MSLPHPETFFIFSNINIIKLGQFFCIQTIQSLPKNLETWFLVNWLLKNNIASSKTSFTS